MKFDYVANWAEYFAILLMVTGFLVAVTIDSMWINFIVIFIAGLMGGKILFERKKTTKFSHYLIVIGFLAGYMIGSYGYRKIVALIFVASVILSYWMHSKGYIDKYMPVKDPHKGHW